MSNRETFNRVQDELMQALRKAQDASKQFIGRKIRIISTYNGQPYGRSKKSLKGTIQIIKYVYVSDTCGLMVSIEKEDCNVLLETTEWEFVDENPDNCMLEVSACA